MGKLGLNNVGIVEAQERLVRILNLRFKYVPLSGSRRYLDGDIYF